MSNAAKIIELRALLAARAPAAPTVRQGRIRTEVPEFDEALDGGLWKGGIVELVGASVTTGSTSLLATCLSKLAEQGKWSALIDGSDAFDPATAAPHLLTHLLWVRCRTASEAIRSADLLLRDGNLPLVCLDLRGNAASELRRIPDPTWYRFQRALEPTSTALLALTPQRLIPCADVRLELQGGFGIDALDCEQPALVRRLRWRVLRKRSSGSDWGAADPLSSRAAEAG